MKSNAVNESCVSFCLLLLTPIKMFFRCSVVFCDIHIFMKGDANFAPKSPFTLSDRESEIFFVNCRHLVWIVH